MKVILKKLALALAIIVVIPIIVSFFTVLIGIVFLFMIIGAIALASRIPIKLINSKRCS